MTSPGIRRVLRRLQELAGRQKDGGSVGAARLLNPDRCRFVPRKINILLTISCWLEDISSTFALATPKRKDVIYRWKIDVVPKTMLGGSGEAGRQVNEVNNEN
jgi:hypothetical protein